MADALGSVVAVTDESGAIIQRSFYEPFGKATVHGSAGDTSAGFVGTLGVQTDDSIGIEYMWNRYYDFHAGIFLSVDPLFRNEITTQAVYNPFSYTSNNPVTLVDVFGLKENCFWSYVKCMAGEVAGPAAGRAVGAVVQNQLSTLADVAVGSFKSLAGGIACEAAKSTLKLAGGLTGVYSVVRANVKCLSREWKCVNQ